MATMFRKPKRNFRQRIAQNDSDEEKMQGDDNSEDSMQQADIMPAKQKKTKEKKDLSKTVLSFDHEEGDTSFQVKKSSYSKKVAKQLKKENEPENNEKLPEIKKETGVEIKHEETQQEVKDRLKKLREELLTMNGDDAANLEEKDSDDEGAFKKMLKRGEIPDATTIHQIRKQRQMARDMGDFLPLDDTVKYENPKSRLVREDDNDKSDDEDERIDFAANQAELERQKMMDNFMRAEHGSDEGSDQEREWEEQQIRKGVSAIQQVSSCQDLLSYDQDSHSMDGMYKNGYPSTRLQQQQQQQPSRDTMMGFSTMPKLILDMQDLTLDGLLRKLKERLTSMEEVHRAHHLESEKLVQDIVDAEMSIEKCETDAPNLENRFRFFQEMRGYVRDLVECLNEKVPEINDLEMRMNNLQRNRSAKFASRRQQDVQDQCHAYMTSKSQVVMDANDHARQRRIAEREARRARRRRAREGKNITGHYEGLSSDDEENQSEITKFNQERDDIVQRVSHLFEDVVEDFSDMDNVRERFVQWKKQYGDNYKEAYIGLCLPRLVNPFVRLQLISWNPLEDHCKDLEEMQWFESLLFYGFEEDEAIDRTDEDIKLIPAVIDKIVLPKLSYIAENIWDPLSTSQNCRFVNHIQKLLRDYPTVSGLSKNTQLVKGDEMGRAITIFRVMPIDSLTGFKNQFVSTSNLLKALVCRMKKTLDDDVFMPLYPKTVLENRTSGPSLFFHRQAWMCIKLLGHFLSWHGIIANKVLQGLALDGLLNRYIVLALQTAPFNQETVLKCQAVVSALPKVWFDNLENEKTIPRLENICRFLMYATQLLDKASDTVTELQRRDLRDQMKQISKLLVNIHALDHVMKLSELYNLGSK